MRLVKIPNLEYKDFEIIRDTIDANIPFAVIDMRYSPKLKVGIFNFWDSDYIPENLQQFIVQPPISRENKDKLKADLIQIEKLQNWFDQK
jgi:hypothetical protein